MQTVTLKTTADRQLLKVFGTQADISHITIENNKKLSFIGLQGEHSFHGIDVFDTSALDNFTPFRYPAESGCPFTKREMKIFRLLVLGLSTEEISNKLCIAIHRYQP